ncbi:MAG TPA: hypothetical protein VNW99_09005, partial [Cytophagaceae bacterium]|nr:hypothetical protein [Cytophagaceae bacterium]
LSSVSGYELERIIRLLKDNPALAIEVGVYSSKVLKDTLGHDDLTEVIIDNSDTTNIKTIYHNDKTQKQSDALSAYLVQKGIPAERVKAKGYGDHKSSLSNYIPLGMQWAEIKVLKE